MIVLYKKGLINFSMIKISSVPHILATMFQSKANISDTSSIKKISGRQLVLQKAQTCHLAAAWTLLSTLSATVESSS